MQDLSSKNRESGATLILFSIMLLLVVLPMIGLAIDGGIAYFAHSRLVSAADAAALAGARSLSIGMDFTSQKQNAQAIAQQYFYANYPTGYLNTKNVSIAADAKETGTHTRTVTVTVGADVSMYFLGLLGHDTTHIGASAQTSRRDVNVVLTLDRSGSMSGVCETMKANAQSFVSKFTNGRDTMGLITFMGNANVDFPSTLNFASQSPNLSDTLAKLKCAGNTGSAAALYLAYQQIKSVAEPGALNVIVFFTDGVPNGFSSGPAPAGFPVKSTSACNGGKPLAGFISQSGGLYSLSPVAIDQTNIQPTACSGNMSYMADNFQYIPDTDAYGNSAWATGYKPVQRDAQNNITITAANSDAVSANAADAAALKIRQDGIFIYTIGLDGNGGLDSTLLMRLANDPTYSSYQTSQPAGMYAYAGNAGQLAAAFNSIASEVLRISQ
jgi:Flp pilus assembly protein TadG